MKKYFFPLLMGFMILMGVLLTVTPWLAEYMVPVKATSFRKAPASEVQEAIATWFQVRTTDLGETQGIQLVSPTRKTAWFKFELDRVPVEKLVRSLQLQQLELTPEILQQRFNSVQLPVDWWHPEALQRKSFFNGKSDNQELSLIYNAELKQGYLMVVTDTAQPSNSPQ